MRRSFLMGLVVALIATLFSLVGIQSAASASEPVEASASATATSMDDVAVDVNVKSAVVVNTDAQGRTVGAWFANPGPQGHWDPTRAAKVPFTASYREGVLSGKPFRLKQGERMPLTLKMRDGTPFQVEGGKVISRPWNLFDRAADGTVRSRGYFNPRTRNWEGDCKNPKPGPEWPTLPPEMVVEVKVHTLIEYDLEVDWTAKSNVYGEVEVDCGSSWARSGFTALGQTTGSLSIRVVARNEVEARTEGSRRVSVDVSTATSVKTDIKIDAVTSVEGSAVAECRGEHQPEEVYESPSVHVTPVACVEYGQTRDVTITVTNPNGMADTAKVTYRGTVYTKPVAAHGQVSFTFVNQAAGTYSGTALLVNADKSRSFTVTVQECEAPDNPGSIIEVTDVNDVIYGNTRTIRVRGVVPNGQTATLRVSALKGTIATGDKTINLGAGEFVRDITYTAPTEGSSDTVTFKLFGADNVLDDEASDTFDLKVPPTDPR